jgi:hypothetical protein
MNASAFIDPVTTDSKEESMIDFMLIRQYSPNWISIEDLVPKASGSTDS